MTGGYLWLKGLTCQELGYHTEAIDSYRKCLEVNSDRNGYLFNTDVRFIKERYSNEIQILRKNLLMIIVFLCAFILVLLIILAVLKIKQINIEKLQAEKQRRIVQKEKEEYARMYNETLAEIDELKQSLKVTMHNPKVRYHISERLTVLNKFIAAHITPTFSKTAIEELEKLMQNKNDFIESTRLSFLIENPRFVEYLKQKGLKEAEIGYCCLYAMGLKGKEISSYLGNSHYKQSSSIRKKLGLTEHDTNLDLYLRGMIAKLQSKSLQ